MTERNTFSRNVRLITGFECTAIPELGYGSLEASGHFDQFESDLRLLTEVLGINTFRAPVPWYRIEKSPQVYDWQWTDRYYEACIRQGLTPIVDICHHSSAPIWTDFAKPDFPLAVADFIDKFSDRYPFITHYTPINEPTATAALCTGPWYPHHPDYFSMIKHMGQAQILADLLLRQKNPNIKIFYTDPAEYKITTDVKLQTKVDQFNAIDRFLNLDLFMGMIDLHHPRYHHLLERGFTEAELADFRSHPLQIDILALDYYLHVEQIEGSYDSPAPPPARGIARLLFDYFNRYKDLMPNMQFALGEMNVRGTPKERLAWLKYGLRESEILQRYLGDRFYGSCWYPAIDSFGWGNGSLMTAFTNDPEQDLDPTGIISINPLTLERNLGEDMPQLYGAYSRREISVHDIPDYPFSATMHNYPIPRLGYRLKANQQKNSSFTDNLRTEVLPGD